MLLILEGKWLRVSFEVVGKHSCLVPSVEWRKLRWTIIHGHPVPGLEDTMHNSFTSLSIGRYININVLYIFIYIPADCILYWNGRIRTYTNAQIWTVLNIPIATLNFIFSVKWYFMATLRVILVMNKWTDIVMDDGWVHPLAKLYLLPSATCDEVLSWRGKFVCERRAENSIWDMNWGKKMHL